MATLTYLCESGAAVSPAQLQRYFLMSYREQRLQTGQSRTGQTGLAQFVDQFLGPDHRIWWAMASALPNPVGCLWLGYTTDPDDGDRHPYLLLLHILPAYRRQGIGRSLTARAEAWAKQQGHRKLSLHVFCQNQGAQEFYQRLDYRPQSVLMAKNI